MNSRIVALIVGIVATITALGQGSPASAASSALLFTSTNAVEGNEVLIYQRNNIGELTFVGAAATDGSGTGTPLGTQDAVVFTGKHLLVVNAGSDTVSVFTVKRNAVTLTDVESSGGTTPVSIAVSRNTVYVLNAGAEPNITAFALTSQGDLVPLEGATTSLAGLAVDPVGIQLNRSGRLLAVTDQGGNQIMLFAVDRAGTLGEPTIAASSGSGPTGVRFNKRGALIVAESSANLDSAGTVSSFTVDKSGNLTPVTIAAPTNQTGSSAVLLTPNDRFVYVLNTGSGTISGFTVDRRTGELVPFTDDGIAAVVGEGADPTDIAVVRNSRVIYVLSPSTGEIIGYAVDTRTGALTPITSVTGVPSSATGLATR